MGRRYGLVFFAEDRLPAAAPPVRHQARTQPIVRRSKDVPLSRPLGAGTAGVLEPKDSEGGAPSVSPKWEIDPVGQPPMVRPLFRAPPPMEASVNGSMTLGSSSISSRRRSSRRAVAAPAAGDAIQRRMGPGGNREDHQAGPRRDQGPGYVGFERCVLLTVRVTDEAGRPVEGAPIRRLDDHGRVWTVVHNADAKGEAKFYVRPSSTGLLSVYDLPGIPAESAGQPQVQYRAAPSPAGDV